VRTSPLRGIGFTANKFVTEAFLDEIAQKRGIDPVAFRLELLKNTPRGRKVVERVAQMADWGRKRDGRGLGFAFIDYSGTLTAGIAEVSLDRGSGQIRAHNFWCTLDCGIPVQPDNVVAQTESSIVYGLGMSLTEHISIKDGAVQQSNFYDSGAAHERSAHHAHRDHRHRQPSNWSGSNGDPSRGPRDCWRNLATHRRALTAHAVHARACQEGARIRASQNRTCCGKFTRRAESQVLMLWAAPSAAHEYHGCGCCLGHP
jgi:hypothetical protein